MGAQPVRVSSPGWASAMFGSIFLDVLRLFGPQIGLWPGSFLPNHSKLRFTIRSALENTYVNKEQCNTDMMWWEAPVEQVPPGASDVKKRPDNNQMHRPESSCESAHP